MIPITSSEVRARTLGESRGHEILKRRLTSPGAEDVGCGDGERPPTDRTASSRSDPAGPILAESP